MDWTRYAWIKRGSRRKSILEELQKAKEPLSANDISKVLNIAISQTSFSLKELVEKKLVECLNPSDKIGKVYRITNDGKEILDGV